MLQVSCAFGSMCYTMYEDLLFCGLWLCIAIGVNVDMVVHGTILRKDVEIS